MVREKLPAEDLQRWSAFGPQFMGGEYLPPGSADSVEIARIAMRSTTGDVIVVRADWKRRRICYSVVDEYETHFTVPIARSTEPLSLAEMIRVIDKTDSDWGIGLVEPALRSNAGMSYQPSLRSFIRVSSDFYPVLGEYYSWRTDAICAEIEAEGLDLAGFIAQFDLGELQLLGEEFPRLVLNSTLIGLLRRIQDLDVPIAELTRHFGQPEQQGWLAECARRAAPLATS